MAKEEVIIVPGKLGNVFKDGDMIKHEFTDYVYDWNTHVPIKREPTYVAYYIGGDVRKVKAIAEVDLKKSKLDEGRIVVKGEPILVDIPIRIGRDSLQSPRYTTFTKLLTHKSTDYL